MDIIILLCHLYLVYLFEFTLPKETTLPEYASLCPRSRFCDTDPAVENIQNNEIGSCCQKCSCDPDCYTVGNCCPDMERFLAKDAINIEPIYACVFPEELLNIPRNLSIPRKMYSNVPFRIIDSCPNKSEPFPKCENPETLQDYVIVSDISNNFVYKNMHCARCNDVKYFTDWTLLTLCPGLMWEFFKTVKDMHDFILKHCLLKARPPESFELEKSTCYFVHLSSIDKCNVTGQWDVDNKVLEEACLKERPTQNTVYRKLMPLFTSYLIFKNVYCYMCNVEQSQRDELEHNFCHAVQFRNTKSLHLHFSAMLDLRTYLSEDTTTKSSHCSPQELMDPFADVCRSLLCPVGTIPVDGHCVNFVTSTSGLCLSFFVNIDVRIGYLTLLSEAWGILETRILAMLLPDHCGLCRTDRYHLNKSSTFVYKIKIYTTSQCSTTQVFSHVRSQILKGQRNISLKYNMDVYQLTLTVVTDGTAVENDNLTVEIVSYKFCDSTVQIKLHHLQNCPRFIIPIEELADIGLNSSILENNQNMTMVLENATNVSICVTTYYKLLQSLRNSQGLNLPFGIIEIVLLFISMYL